jgi:hypothetical protein
MRVGTASLRMLGLSQVEGSAGSVVSWHGHACVTLIAYASWLSQFQSVRHVSNCTAAQWQAVLYGGLMVTCGWVTFITICFLQSLGL